ncbi:MAG: helix-turn-helix domain-containing protein [Desulfocapsaceae bacterium]|nr:helix-turn-helix domain-containing protein [Desulfocapsaceae bacterium]
MSQFELKKPIRSEQDIKALIESGDIAIIGPHALAVYLVINAEQTFPTVKVLCKKSGISDKPVRRSLMVLEEYGYIGKKETKQAQGCSAFPSGA